MPSVAGHHLEAVVECSGGDHDIGVAAAEVEAATLDGETARSTVIDWTGRGDTVTVFKITDLGASDFG